MPDPSKTLPPATCVDLSNAISSLGLPVGHSPFKSPGGRQTDQSGPALAPASLSPRQAKEAGLTTSGTFGLPGIGSSNSAALQRLLESKLQARLDITGLILYLPTWKGWITPVGRQFCLLRSLARTTKGTAYSGWPTPRVGTSGGYGNAARASKGRSEDVVPLAGWATPTTRDYRFANALPWVDRGGGSKGEQLNNQVRHCLEIGAPMRITRLGEILTGSSAGMDVSGQLNPEFTRWLMGYPTEWGCCGGMVTRLSLKLRRNS